eukprot:TRINITY_DN2644_c0_g2_i1.p1 TRINITY_DN2644_c0_g2~~TRINITY_DN2644_c0_g2_i1.p1  ORF type:complete len:1656 (-),score=277.25 TRINITY_DN2644_c0_g2_i1:486-5216(-)
MRQQQALAQQQIQQQEQQQQQVEVQAQDEKPVSTEYPNQAQATSGIATGGAISSEARQEAQIASERIQRVLANALGPSYFSSEKPSHQRESATVRLDSLSVTQPQQPVIKASTQTQQVSSSVASTSTPDQPPALAPAPTPVPPPNSYAAALLRSKTAPQKPKPKPVARKVSSAVAESSGQNQISQISAAEDEWQDVVPKRQLQKERQKIKEKRQQPAPVAQQQPKQPTVQNKRMEEEILQMEKQLLELQAEREAMLRISQERQMAAKAQPGWVAVGQEHEFEQHKQEEEQEGATGISQDDYQPQQTQPVVSNAVLLPEDLSPEDFNSENYSSVRTVQPQMQRPLQQQQQHQQQQQQVHSVPTKPQQDVISTQIYQAWAQEHQQLFSQTSRNAQNLAVMSPKVAQQPQQNSSSYKPLGSSWLERVKKEPSQQRSVQRPPVRKAAIQGTQKRDTPIQKQDYANVSNWVGINIVNAAEQTAKENVYMQDVAELNLAPHVTTETFSQKMDQVQEEQLNIQEDVYNQQSIDIPLYEMEQIPPGDGTFEDLQVGNDQYPEIEYIEETDLQLEYHDYSLFSHQQGISPEQAFPNKVEFEVEDQVQISYPPEIIVEQLPEEDIQVIQEIEEQAGIDIIEVVEEYPTVEEATTSQNQERQEQVSRQLKEDLVMEIDQVVTSPQIRSVSQVDELANQQQIPQQVKAIEQEEDSEDEPDEPGRVYTFAEMLRRKPRKKKPVLPRPAPTQQLPPQQAQPAVASKGPVRQEPQENIKKDIQVPIPIVDEQPAVITVTKEKQSRQIPPKQQQPKQQVPVKDNKQPSQQEQQTVQQTKQKSQQQQAAVEQQQKPQIVEQLQKAQIVQVAPQKPSRFSWASIVAANASKPVQNLRKTLQRRAIQHEQKEKAKVEEFKKKVQNQKNLTNRRRIQGADSSNVQPDQEPIDQSAVQEEDYVQPQRSQSSRRQQKSHRGWEKPREVEPEVIQFEPLPDEDDQKENIPRQNIPYQQTLKRQGRPLPKLETFETPVVHPPEPEPLLQQNPAMISYAEILRRQKMASMGQQQEVKRSTVLKQPQAKKPLGSSNVQQGNRSQQSKKLEEKLSQLQERLGIASKEQNAASTKLRVPTVKSGGRMTLSLSRNKSSALLEPETQEDGQSDEQEKGGNQLDLPTGSRRFLSLSRSDKNQENVEESTAAGKLSLGGYGQHNFGLATGRRQDEGGFPAAFGLRRLGRGGGGRGRGGARLTSMGGAKIDYDDVPSAFRNIRSRGQGRGAGGDDAGRSRTVEKRIGLLPFPTAFGGRRNQNRQEGAGGGGFLGDSSLPEMPSAFTRSTRGGRGRGRGGGDMDNNLPEMPSAFRAGQRSRGGGNQGQGQNLYGDMPSAFNSAFRSRGQPQQQSQFGDMPAAFTRGSNRPSQSQSNFPSAFGGRRAGPATDYSDMPSAFQNQRTRQSQQSDMPDAFNMGRRGAGRQGQDFPSAFTGGRRTIRQDGYSDSLSFAASNMSQNKVGRATLGAFLGDAPEVPTSRRSFTSSVRPQNTMAKEDFPTLGDVKEEFPSLGGSLVLGGQKWGDIMDDEVQKSTLPSFKDALQTQYEDY